MKQKPSWLKHWFNEDEIRIIAFVLSLFLLGAVVKAYRQKPEIHTFSRPSKVQALPEHTVPRQTPEEE
jgi:hypothetical protein